MSASSFNELHDFHRFVGEYVDKEGASLSPEEILDRWRHLHPTTASVDEDLSALQEAIDDLESGDIGVPFEEFDQDFRARRNLPWEVSRGPF